MTKLEEIARRHAESSNDPAYIKSIVLAAMREMREELAKVAEQDSYVQSSIAVLTRNHIADAIRRWGEE